MALSGYLNSKGALRSWWLHSFIVSSKGFFFFSGVLYLPISIAEACTCNAAHRRDSSGMEEDHINFKNGWTKANSLPAKLSHMSQGDDRLNLDFSKSYFHSKL